MKQLGVIKSIRANSDNTGYHTELRDNVGKYYSKDIPSYKYGDKVTLWYRIDKDHGFFIEKIENYMPDPLSQRECDINISVIMKIIGNLASNGKIELEEKSLLKEARKWLNVHETLRNSYN